MSIVQLPVTIIEVADEIIELWAAGLASAPGQAETAEIRAHHIAEGSKRIGPLWCSLDGLGMRDEIEGRLEAEYDRRVGVA